MWGLVGRLGGQLRISPGGKIIGWDMAAVLALSNALQICPTATAIFLPEIEAVMVRETNDQGE